MSKISDLIFHNENHYITSPFGKRSAIKTDGGVTSTFHSGTDYGTHGKKLAQYAIEEGYVFDAGKASDGALYVWVIYPRIKKAFLHYHLNAISVKGGQAVNNNTKLGTTGKTGKATGIHLHLGIRDLNVLSATKIERMTRDALCMCDYVDPEKVSYTAPVMFTGYVNVDANSSLNVRSGAGITKTKVGSLKRGEAVTVIGQSGSWYQINYGNGTAYVSKTYISKTKPATYFPKYTGKSVSIDDALKAVTGNYGFSFRAKIASANKMSGYRGTASQNNKMLKLLKQGKLIKP